MMCDHVDGMNCVHICLVDSIGRIVESFGVYSV